MAATDKSRQTCLASTRTPTPIVVLKLMVLSFQQIVVNVSIPKTTSDTFQLTIRLNIPTIQALESHKITTNNPTTTEKDRQQQLQTLVSFVNPNIIFLQQWNLPVAISPSPDIRDKQSLPLQIPSPDIISDWPAHLFPTQGDFGRHIKKQLVAQFTRHLTVLQQQRFHSIARYTLHLSLSSHLVSDDRPASNLWQCSTSLFSLTCFYELSNQAFLNPDNFSTIL
jgi:hypothetical protein